MTMPVSFQHTFGLANGRWRKESITPIISSGSSFSSPPLFIHQQEARKKRSTLLVQNTGHPSHLRDYRSLDYADDNFFRLDFFRSSLPNIFYSSFYRTDGCLLSSLHSIWHEIKAERGRKEWIAWTSWRQYSLGQKRLHPRVNFATSVSTGHSASGCNLLEIATASICFHCGQTRKPVPLQ